MPIMDMDDSVLRTRFIEEFLALSADTSSYEFLATPLELWAVFCQLQLAFRHVANVGPTRKIAESVARRIQGIVAPSGALAEVAAKGWDSRFDE